MKRMAGLLFSAIWGVLFVAACGEIPGGVIQTMVAQPAAPQAAAWPNADVTPGGFSLLATPTLDAIGSGPMGTWTAIALTIAPPTPDPTQYEIVLRGNPHFIEFHAWW